MQWLGNLRKPPNELMIVRCPTNCLTSFIDVEVGKCCTAATRAGLGAIPRGVTTWLRFQLPGI